MLSVNRDDHKIGYKCLDAFLRIVGKAFKGDSVDKRHESTFTFLVPLLRLLHLRAT
jgi:hypothetical protein